MPCWLYLCKRHEMFSHLRLRFLFSTRAFVYHARKEGEEEVHCPPTSMPRWLYPCKRHEMLSHLRVRFFIFQDNRPVRENKNVRFSMLTCVACMRSLTGLTSHVHVVLQPLPLPSTLSSALLKGYVVAALGTLNIKT